MGSLPYVIVVLALWRLASQGLVAVGMHRADPRWTWVHTAFLGGALGAGIAWNESLPEIRVPLACFLVFLYVGFRAQSVGSESDSWSARRTRLATAIILFPSAALVATLWSEPRAYFLIFALAVYRSVHRFTIGAVEEQRIDSEAMRVKILSLGARLHNEGAQSASPPRQKTAFR